MSDSLPPDINLRHVPAQTRSRERVSRLLDAADDLLGENGALALTATRVAKLAGVSIGSFYHYFPDRDAIVDALALRYWSDFEDLVAGVAEADELEPVGEPAETILGVLAAGFRARPGFRALWYGGLRTERVRDTTRPTRTAIARSVQRILAAHYPDADPDLYAVVAPMAVLVGDGLLREAFRLDPGGDDELLAEGEMVLRTYLLARLG